MKKTFYYVCMLIILFISFKIFKYYFTSEFETGTCLQADDGYIWHINRFSFGDYYVTGWQKHVGYWGNEVDIEKDSLEREVENGIKKYHTVVCPILGQVESKQNQFK